jgi:hypothetical protein
MNGYDIRIATGKDKEYIEQMCFKFFQEAPHSKLKDPYSFDRVSGLIEDYLKGPKESRIIFVLTFKDKPVGMIAGLAYPNLFTNTFVALEQMWWVDAEHRGQVSTALIDMYEVWAKKVGCTSCIVSSLNTDHANLLDRLYTKRGYMKTETAYTKDLD